MRLIREFTYSTVVALGGRGVPCSHKITTRQKDISPSPGTREDEYEARGSGTEIMNCPPPVWRESFSLDHDGGSGSRRTISVTVNIRGW